VRLISQSCRNIAQVPKARGQYSRNCGKSASLLIDDDSHYLFCYTSDQNGDGINFIIYVILHHLLYTTATITNLRLQIRSRDVVRLRLEFIYCIKCYLAIKTANELF